MPYGMVGTPRARSLRTGGRMAPPEMWKQFAGHGGGGTGANVGVPMSIMDRVAAQPDPPPAPVAPPTAAMSNGGEGSIFSAIATPDTIASNASFDAERHNNAPAVKDAADSARIAEQSGMPQQAAGQRTFDEMKQQMIAEYKNTLQRAQQRRAQLADQEKEWGGFGGKIAEMFGGVAQFRMARRNQMMAGIQAEDQMANDLAERINGPDKIVPVTGGYVGRDGYHKTAVPKVRYTKEQGTDASGRPTVRYVKETLDGSSDPEVVNPEFGDDFTPETKGSLAKDKQAADAARAEKVAQIRATTQKLIASQRNSEAIRWHNFEHEYQSGRLTDADLDRELKALAEGRKAASTDDRRTGALDLEGIRDLENRLKDQNLTPEARGDLQLKLDHARNQARTRPKVADVVKPKAKGYQVVAPGGAKYKITGRID